MVRCGARGRTEREVMIRNKFSARDWLLLLLVFTWLDCQRRAKARSAEREGSRRDAGVGRLAGQAARIDGAVCPGPHDRHRAAGGQRARREGPADADSRSAGGLFALLDEIEDNIEMYASHKADMRKGLTLLIEANSEWQLKLRRLKEQSPPEELDQFSFVLDNCRPTRSTTWATMHARNCRSRMSWRNRRS